MTRLRSTAFAAACWLSTAGVAPALAHPGHGTTDGLLHYLAEPVHVAFGLLAVAAGLAACRLVALPARKRARRRR